MQENNYEIINSEIKVDFIYIIRLIVFLVGIFTLSLGVAIIINAKLGVATWDVLHIGLANLTNISIGRWVQIVGVIMVLMTSIFEKKRPAIGSVLNILLVGFFLNCILNLNIIPKYTGIMPRSILLVLGIILMGIGSGMYVASKLGAGPRDGMTLFIANRFSISIRLSRTILELIALTIGWLIGGPVSFGTFVTVVLIGPAMQMSLKFWTRQMKKLGYSE